MNSSILYPVIRTFFLNMGLDSFFDKVKHKFLPINTHTKKYIGPVFVGMSFRVAEVDNHPEGGLFYDVDIVEDWIEQKLTDRDEDQVGFYAFSYGTKDAKAWSEQGIKTYNRAYLKDVKFYGPY